MKNPFENLGRKKSPESPQQSEWDNLDAVEFAGDTEAVDKEKANAERQQRKITAYLLYGKLPEYIATPDVRLNAGDEDLLLDRLASGAITDSDKKDLLSSMKSPVSKKGPEAVFASLEGDKHQLRILAHHSGLGFNNYSQASPNALQDFLSHFPTPLDFEAQSEIFLNSIKRGNSPQKVQEYIADMAAFKRNVYGKRQEYYEQIKALEEKAAERERQKTVEMPAATGEQAETIVKDFGYYEMSRAQVKAGMTANNPGDRLPQDYTEDAHLLMPEQGLFAVFDGAGGTNNVNGGARIASQTAAAKVHELASNLDLANQGNLAWALNEASRAIEADPRAGLSTGVVAKVIEENGAKKLAYASVGDSRIYIVRENSFVIPVTKDEGEGKFITNALGRINSRDHSSRTKQLGSVDLWPGDRIVLCSDGITGDKPEEAMSDNQIAAIVGLAWNPYQAAVELTEQARKTDDRTAIVFEV